MASIFVAGGTRTGSTHIRNCFGRLGLKPASLYAGYENSYNEEHMIDQTAAAVLFPLDGLVFFHHMRALGRNLPILKEWGVRPIVTYRNVLDCMVSWRESHEKGISDMGERVGEQWIFLPVYGVPGWTRLTEHEKWLWIAYNVLPWWFSFYVSWRESGLDCYFSGYKEHYTNQVAGLRGMIEHQQWKVRPTDKQLESVCYQKDGRFNVGVNGRGKSILPPEVVEIAYKQAYAWGSAWESRLVKALLEE